MTAIITINTIASAISKYVSVEVDGGFVVSVVETVDVSVGGVPGCVTSGFWPDVISDTFAEIANGEKVMVFLQRKYMHRSFQFAQFEVPPTDCRPT